MANHKSSLKRAKQSEVRRMRNKAVKTRVKTAAKAISTAENPQEQLPQTQSVIDKAAKKGVLHKRTASRKISRLAKKVNAATAE